MTIYRYAGADGVSRIEMPSLTLRRRVASLGADGAPGSHRLYMLEPCCFQAAAESNLLGSWAWVSLGKVHVMWRSQPAAPATAEPQPSGSDACQACYPLYYCLPRPPRLPPTPTPHLPSKHHPPPTRPRSTPPSSSCISATLSRPFRCAPSICSGPFFHLCPSRTANAVAFLGPDLLSHLSLGRAASLLSPILTSSSCTRLSSGAAALSGREPYPSDTMTEVSSTRLYLGNLPRNGPDLFQSDLTLPFRTH